MLKLVLKKKKRKAGMRAGMTRARIAEAAGKLQLEGGADNFSIRAVAKALGVVPATIRSHFKGGMDDLLAEITRSALAELTPPYKPQQIPRITCGASFAPRWQHSGSSLSSAASSSPT